MKISQIIAHIFSFLLQPLLMTLYSVLLLFIYTNFYDIYYGQIWRFIVPVLIFSFVMPALFIFVLKKLKIIKSYFLIDRQDRFLPYLMTAFSHIVLVYYFYQSSHIYFWFLGLLSVPVIILVVTFIINIFWGISPHMLGIGGLTGGVMSICFNVKGLNPFILFIILFILAGCLAASRMLLKRETPGQIHTGFLIGLVLAFITVWISTLLIA